MLDAAIAVFLIFTSLWIESAGAHIELRRPKARFTAGRSSAAVTAVTGGVTTPPKPPQEAPDVTKRRCDIEWREAS
jgi:hypothetical protein